MKFPFVSGVGSDGSRYDLPDDLGDAPSLVHVSFGTATDDVTGWRSLATELEDDAPDLAWYEMRVTQQTDDDGDDGRPVTDGGGAEALAAGDDGSTLTLYTDERGLRTALSLDDATDGCTLLLDGDEVLWAVAGPVTDEAETELRALLAS